MRALPQAPITSFLPGISRTTVWLLLARLPLPAAESPVEGRSAPSLGTARKENLCRGTARGA